jgi:hypothetical protein
MNDFDNLKQQLSSEGFTIVDGIFDASEVASILSIIGGSAGLGTESKNADGMFGIRRFITKFPGLPTQIFNKTLIRLINDLFGDGYFVVKSIYFDKPPASNWFVAYHQDLSIAVREKIPVEGYGPWSSKPEGFAVQPPLEILENNFTIRIHLDDADENNGALKVVPSSHSRGICRAATINWETEGQVTCNVKKGGIMIMRPLLLHASGRTTNGQRRRVIHIEFSNHNLPSPLQWAEVFSLSATQA